MSYLQRLQSLPLLGDAIERIACFAQVSRVEQQDDERFDRLGDTTGATERAQEFAAELAARVKTG